MKRCNQCGAKLADTAKFCAECGAEYIAPKPKPEPTKPVLLIRKIIYSLDEAAAALSISVRKLQQLIADGEIAACRQGRNIGITEWALIEYAKSKEVISGEAMRGELKVL